MTDLPEFILSQGEAFTYLAGQNRLILDTLAQMETRLMALSQAETEALNRLKGEINEFRTKAETTEQTLRAEITRLTDLAGQLQANDSADAAQIAQLQQSISNLEAARATHETEVVGAIDAVTNELDQLGGNP